MVHATSSVCDWRGLGSIRPGIVIDYDGKIHWQSDESQVGSMPRLLQITDKQIASAYEINIGAVRAIGNLDEWLVWIEASLNARLPSTLRDRLTTLLHCYLADPDHTADQINEGGFVIRMVEWLTKIIQWRWFTETYGQSSEAGPESPVYTNISETSRRRFRRPRIPPALMMQPIPSVLPFHTVKSRALSCE